MAMTGAGLAALRKLAVDEVLAVQSSNPSDAIAHSEAVLLADSTAIVNYIHSYAHAVGSDSRGDSHNLTIE